MHGWMFLLIIKHFLSCSWNFTDLTSSSSTWFFMKSILWHSQVISTMLVLCYPLSIMLKVGQFFNRIIIWFMHLHFWLWQLSPKLLSIKEEIGGGMVRSKVVIKKPCSNIWVRAVTALTDCMDFFCWSSSVSSHALEIWLFLLFYSQPDFSRKHLVKFADYFNHAYFILIYASHAWSSVIFFFIEYQYAHCHFWLSQF